MAEGAGRKHWFDAFASAAATWTGHAAAFIASRAFVGVGDLGPLFHFSDTWQLVINTGTTVLTFLMVFGVQSTMNWVSAAVHLNSTGASSSRPRTMHATPWWVRRTSRRRSSTRLETNEIAKTNGASTSTAKGNP